MNERHPSQYSPDYDAYGYDAYSPGPHQTVGTTFSAPVYSDDTTGTYGYPPQAPQYDQSQGQPQAQGYGGYGYQGHDGYEGYDAGYATGYATGYDQPAAPGTAGYDTGGYAVYDPYAYPAAPQQSQQSQQSQPQQQAAGATYYDTGTYDTGTYDTGALWQGVNGTAGSGQQQDWDSGAYPAYGYG